MSQRKDQLKKNPQAEEKKSVPEGRLLAEGEHSLFSDYTRFQVNRFLRGGANITFINKQGIHNLNLENGAITLIKDKYKTTYDCTHLSLGQNADPLSNEIIIFDHWSFSYSSNPHSRIEFKLLAKDYRFFPAQMIILNSSYILCDSRTIRNLVLINSKSKEIQKIVLPERADDIFVFRQDENKFKLFISSLKKGVFSVEINLNQKKWFSQPVHELIIENSSITRCAISPDQREIQLVLYDAPYDRSCRVHIQTRKLDDQWKTAEPLFDHDQSENERGGIFAHPYSSDSSFYFQYQNSIYQVNKGTVTAIAELPSKVIQELLVEIIQPQLYLTTDDRLIVLTKSKYFLYSTPCYELNCKIQAILPVILLRMQMPDQGAAAALAQTKDPWSIVQGYVGFFQAKPLKKSDTDLARVMLIASITEMLISIPDNRVEKDLFKALLKHLQDPTLSINTCAAKIETQINSGLVTPVSSFNQFLKDLVIAFSEQTDELKQTGSILDRIARLFMPR